MTVKYAVTFEFDMRPPVTYRGTTSGGQVSTCMAMTPQEKRAAPESINPGVRRLVELLNEWAFTTIDSGDGVTNVAAGIEGALNYPHVHIRSTGQCLVVDARGLREMLAQQGIKVEPVGPDPRRPSIQATYDPADNSAVITLTGVNDAMLSGGGND